MEAGGKGREYEDAMNCMNNRPKFLIKFGYVILENDNLQKNSCICTTSILLLHQPTRVGSRSPNDSRLIEFHIDKTG